MPPAAVLSVFVQTRGIREANRDLKGLDDHMEATGKRGSKALALVGKATKAAAIGIAGGVALAAPKLLKLASDAEETASKFRTVFGRETPRAIGQLDAFSKATGTSRFALREQAAGLQALIRPMGLSTKNAADLSVGMTKLATDLASFNNTSVDEAITALQSGLVGEAEPLRRFGVQLSATRVQAFAYAKGIARQGEELTSAQKAQASYGIIMQDTKLAQGDATRTAGSFANQVKRAKSTVTDMATELGMRLKPAALAVVQGFTSFAAGIRDGTGVGGAFVGVLQSIGGAFVAIGSAVFATVRWFNEHRTVTFALGAAVGVLTAALIAARVAALLPMIPVLYSQVAAWIALKAAMLTNPFVLAAAALATLAAALVVAYRESETFRDIVTAAWGAIRAVTMAVWGAISEFLVAVWSALRTSVTTYFNAYRQVIETTWAVVSAVTTAVWGALRASLTATWSGLRTAATSTFNAIETVITGVWGAIRTVTSAAWATIRVGLSTTWDGIHAVATTAWDGIRLAILTPIRFVRDTIGTVVDGIANRMATGWDAIKTTATTFAGNLKDAIFDAFRGAANGVIGFVNAIISAVNKIPGVPNIGMIAKLAEGGINAAKGGPNGTGKLARGGAFGMTGGLVNHPITLMGEEAPRHPEFVIPTNPAYRSRAQMLLGQAAGAIGLAEGGVVSAFRGAIGRTNANPKPALALWMAGIVESGLRNLPYGDRDSRGALQIRDSTARGMGINNMDPMASALAFLTRGFWRYPGGAIGIAARNPGFSAGQVAQGTQGSAFPGRYDGVRGQALEYAKSAGKEGVFDKIGDFIGGAADKVGGILSGGAGAILGLLPNPADFLPDWLKGLGSYAIDKVTGWIKDKVSSIIPDFGGGGGGDVGGLRPQVLEAIKFARTMGWRGAINSGFRSREEQQRLYDLYRSGRGNLAAPPGNSMHERGLAIDVSDTEGFARAMAIMGEGRLYRKVPGEPWHFSTTGYRKGGLYPFAGSFANGGIVPGPLGAPRTAVVHGGEKITGLGHGDGPLVHIENWNAAPDSDPNAVAARLAWLAETA